MTNQKIAPLNKLEFEKFLNEELTVAENRQYTKKVDDIFVGIVESIFKGYGYDVVQFDYNVDPYDDDVDEGCNSFNVELFKENVAFYAQVVPSDKNIATLPTSFISLYKQFPTSWFYTDFKEDLQKIISQDNEKYEKYKQEQEQEVVKETKKIQGYEEEIKNARMKILDIVPPELLKYISFVSAENLEANVKMQKDERKRMREKKIKKLRNSGFNIPESYKKYQSSGGGEKFDEWIESL